MIGKALNWGLHRMVQKIGLDVLIPFTLLTLTLLSFVFGLQNILVKTDGDALALTTLLALLTGWFMGKPQSQKISPYLITGIIGILFVVLHTLNLWLLLALLLRSALEYIWQAIINFPTDNLPDISSLIILWEDINLKISDLLVRSGNWLQGFFSGYPNFDSVVSVFLWSLILWFAASWAAWWYRRTRQTLTSILPAGIFFASCLSYTRASTYFLVPFVIGLFLLLAWNQYHSMQIFWQQRKTDVAEDIGSDTAMWVLAISTVVILFSLLFSIISPQKIFQFAREYTAQSPASNQEFGQALGLEQQSSGASSGYQDDPGSLPRSHLIGAPPELSKEIALIIQLSHEEGESISVQNNDVFQHLYFRSSTYDEYTGQGWKTNPTENQELNAGEVISGASNPGFPLISQTIEFGLNPGGFIYYAGTPFVVNQASQVVSRETPEDGFDLYALTSALAADVKNLQIDSYIADTGIIQLTETNQEYPQWIIDRYLQLPDELPDEVKNLALQITEGLSTPYDKVKAIETYLRTYPYSLEIPPPPSTGDISAYFLFELKRGYCDYYATTMTVLARAAGIPARFVVGYASGMFNQDEGRTIITEADAHSWVEVYFPGVGWIEFEPTAGLEAIERPLNKPIDVIPVANLPPNEGNAEFYFLDQKWLVTLVAVLFFIFILAAVVIYADTRRLLGLSPSHTALVVYQRLVNLIQPLDIQTRPNPTPNELLHDFSHNGEIQNHNSLTGRLLKQKEQNIQIIIQNYNRASYSPTPVNREQQKLITQAWIAIRSRLQLARFWKSIQKRMINMRN